MKKCLCILATALLCCQALYSQNLSVAANLADCANLGTLNATAGYALSQHWSLEAGIKYNPFSYGQEENPFQSRQRSVAAGARWWPWNVYSGWWAAGALRYQEYNQGGMLSARTTEGDRYGGVLRGGYAMMLTPHLNLDVGLGVWGGYDVYRVYACPRCGRVEADGAGYFFKMSDIIVALSLIF